MLQSSTAHVAGWCPKHATGCPLSPIWQALAAGVSCAHQPPTSNRSPAARCRPPATEPTCTAAQAGRWGQYSVWLGGGWGWGQGGSVSRKQAGSEGWVGDGEIGGSQAALLQPLLPSPISLTCACPTFVAAATKRSREQQQTAAAAIGSSNRDEQAGMQPLRPMSGNDPHLRHLAANLPWP